MALKERSITLCVGRGPETLQEAENTCIADCKARNLSPQTVTVNGIILKGLAGFLRDKAPDEVTGADLRRFFIEKATATSPATAARSKS